MERPPPSAAPPRPVYCGVALHPQLTVPVVSTSPDPAEIYPAQALYPRFLSSSECISLSPSNGDLWRTSLPVQWLRICLAMQGTWVRSLVKELRSHGATKPERPTTERPRATARECHCREDPTRCTQDRCSQKTDERINGDV